MFQKVFLNLINTKRDKVDQKRINKWMNLCLHGPFTLTLTLYRHWTADRRVSVSSVWTYEASNWAGRSSKEFGWNMQCLSGVTGASSFKNRQTFHVERTKTGGFGPRPKIWDLILVSFHFTSLTFVVVNFYFLSAFLNLFLHPEQTHKRSYCHHFPDAHRNPVSSQPKTRSIQTEYCRRKK